MSCEWKRSMSLPPTNFKRYWLRKWVSASSAEKPRDSNETSPSTTTTTKKDATMNPT